jgi:hypothetical protein
VLILAIWLMLLDTALALAAPLPLMLAVDHRLVPCLAGGQP